ncbi:MAG: SDR family oxidoreductase [Anaerolineales bacterium]|nr:SDR family oxidoreductase [Anaerolineales bacterium]
MLEFPLALVTGAAHRLGRAFALALARQGYAILLHYHLSAVDANEAASEIQSLGVPVYLVQADLTNTTDLYSLFSTLDILPHRLKVLVNSAALMPRGDVRTLSAADFDSALALNLRAPFLCAQESAKRMEAGGLIVNVTDVGALKAWSGFPAYTVSKAALESLTRLQARSLAPKIRVNAIAPGLVLPSGQVSQEEWQRLVERLPLKRPASVDEIASALEFLLKNEYITGQTIVVDGGYSLI